MTDNLTNAVPSDILSRLGSTRSLLDLVDLAAPPELLDGPPRKHWKGSVTPADLAGLSFDPAAGKFLTSSKQHGGDTNPPLNATSWLTFPDPRIGYELTVATTADHSAVTGAFDLALTLPAAVLILPQLRGAKLDAQNLLVEDPDQPVVRFYLPSLVVRIKRTSDSGDASTKLESPPPDDPEIFQFCRMEPPHALIGPGTVLGFTFRAAILDLSEKSNPPAAAKSLPTDWQGIYLPEVRLFVAPHGLEDLAVAAGAKDLWIGIGAHAGVTGTFEIDVVNRGAAPIPRVRFHDPQGRFLGTEGTAPSLSAALPPTCQIVVDATGGTAPYSISIDVGGTITAGDRADVSTPDDGTKLPIRVTVTDAGTHPAPTLTIMAARRPGALGPIPGDGSGQPTTVDSPGKDRILKSGEGADSVEVTVADTSTGSITWDAPAVAEPSNPWRALVPVLAGESTTITAHRNVAAGEPVTLTTYFHYEHPKAPEDSAGLGYSLEPANTNAAPAVGTTSAAWSTPAALRSSPEWQALAALPEPSTVGVEGFASFDGHSDPPTVRLNQELARRRADGLAAILAELKNLQSPTITAHGFDAGRAAEPDAVHDPAWWKAVATHLAVSDSRTELTATITRPAPNTPAPSVTPANAEPARPGFPDWFHRVSLTVRLERGDVVLVQLTGEIDIRTPAEQKLAGNDPQATLPKANPSDGICQFGVRLDLDRTAATWKVTADFRAVDADRDGLWTVKRDDGHKIGVNTLGGYAALGPVLAAIAPPDPASAAVVPLVLAATAIPILATLDVLKTKQMILRGAEMVVDHGPKGTNYVLMLDLETAIGFDAGVVKVDLAKPITTRYKAIGLLVGDRDGGAFQARPMFDPSKGYKLDIPAGAVVGAGPLADILRILGANVSRDNPTFLEVELGLGVDLGIVTVDRARLRLKLDPPLEPPTLTALGATIDVPGAFKGRGYLRVDDNGLTGRLDIEIKPVGIRAQAGISIQTKDGVHGMFLEARLELPMAIPLGSSGLGIYGFAAGIGANMGRTPAATPLDWLAARVNHDPLDPTGWTLEAGAWAFAIGATLGTMEGGFILRMQGLVLLELPGPRVLILMKARILVPPTSADDYPILAAIDISPDAITIGLVAEYSFASVVKLKIPVRVFFNFHELADWQFDLGTFSDPVVVSVLDVFKGTGYFMIHGKGINPGPPSLPGVTTAGLTLAVGFHVQFVWGDTDIGLYAKVAGGFDALVSIDPVFVAGTLTVSGELRLFIVSISASATLDVQTDGSNFYLHGKICGKVDFFFFSVGGCVDFTLNSELPRVPLPPPLVDGVALVSRSPALVEGSGTDTPIDGVIGRAQEAGGPVQPLGEPIPLDSVPVIEFSVVPSIAPGFTVLGTAPSAEQDLTAPAWSRRGPYWWRYEVRSVTMTPVPAPGPTPTTWWSGGPHADPLEGIRLALLSWVPNSSPRAVPYGDHLTTLVHHTWGSTCDPVAAPAPTLFTFDAEPVGSSAPGWDLTGVLWPDDPGSFTTAHGVASLRVDERWRCGVTEADLDRGVSPAEVLTGGVTCPDDDPELPSMQALAARSGGISVASALTSPDQLATLTAAISSGVTPRELPILLRQQSADDKWRCRARVLRSPRSDTTEVSVHPDPDGDGVIKDAWQSTNFSPSELLDSVLLHTGEVESVDVLYAASERAIGGRALLFRYLAADGSTLGEEVARDVTSSGLTGLDPHWWDPAGPWRSPVLRSAELLAWIAARERLDVSSAHLKPPPGTDRIEMGLLTTPEQARQPFYLAGLEMVTPTERRRFGRDTRTQQVRKETLTTVLAKEIDDYAMLTPGEDYTVAVTWQGFFADGAPIPTGNGTSTPEVTQTFTFKAGTSAQVPTRLDPWVIDTDPGDHESSAFCDDPVRLSFATQNVVKLFDKYGYDIQLVLHGSSGRHPNPDGSVVAGAPPVPIALNPTVPSSGLRILTAWEEAVRAANLPCVPAGSKDSHVSQVIPYPLELRTDYLLDLLLRPRDGRPTMLAYRHGFTTSRYRSLAEFAASIRGVVPEHVSVANPAALQALPEAPTGDQLDVAFVAAGLDRLGVPRTPRLLVLWTADVVPQPVAVVVDADEALWRRRVAPALAPAPPDPPDPRDLTGHHWTLARFEWLTPNAGGTSVVTRMVEGPGAQRAVFLLGADQRGSTLSLRLDRANDPITATGAATGDLGGLLLDAAPWENNDDEVA